MSEILPASEVIIEQVQQEQAETAIDDKNIMQTILEQAEIHAPDDLGERQQVIGDVIDEIKDDDEARLIRRDVFLALRLRQAQSRLRKTGRRSIL